jgi:hypothetical protein
MAKKETKIEQSIDTNIPIQFKSIKEFAVESNVSYDKMRTIIGKIFPKRKQGKLNPKEVYTLKKAFLDGTI